MKTGISPSHRQSVAGFTLVELAIVLVIIGLLVGGILVGRDMIRDAEVRSVITQESRYITAVNSFRDKYFGLPGDITNASSWWGAADGTTGSTAACATTTTGDSKTCNGNGDQKINISSYSNEYFRFWQHLANAGLIEGQYSGIDAGTSGFYVTTANSPSGRLSSSLWFVASPGTNGTITGDNTRFDGYYNNIIQFGGGPNNNSDNWGVILSPLDLYNIDSKMDDGMPGSGKVVARQPTTPYWSGTACTTATASSQITATYLLTDTNRDCVIYFRQVF